MTEIYEQDLIVSVSLTALSAFTAKSAFADTDVVKTVGKVSLTATSMAAGTVAGTPIAIMRKTGSQYIGCLNEFKKDSNTYKFWGAAYSAPVAVISGLIKGTVSGAKNAVRYSIDKPFGKDAFSLGHLEDNLSTNAKTKTNSASKYG